VLQPGRYDKGVAVTDHLGNLTNYVPILFGGTNTVDAAIASTSIDLLGNATPLGYSGYGMPRATTTDPSVGMSVQKFGRTTKLTKGSIYAINWVGYIGYTGGNAYFTNQFVVRSAGAAFVKAGDSGSLVVNTNRNPVGLLFAGDTSGKYGICNDIDLVLSQLGVTIDGE